MADVLCKNPMSLRGCILYEFLKKREPFKTYKKLMKTLGDDSMTYPEFEFWFMRFAQGNFDLDYDYSRRSVKSPICRSRSSKKSLTYPEFEFWYMRFAQGNFDLDYDFSLEPKKRQITDLPVEIFEKVGDSLDLKDRVNLRLVSKDIQFLVDNWNPKVTEFTYLSSDRWKIVQNSETYEFGNWKTHAQSASIGPSLPLPAVVRMLKNPKLRLKKLTNSHGIIDLSLLAPESLEEVSLRINDKAVKKMNEILQSEHCKQLKMLTISTDLSPSNFPFGSFIGYPRFTIRIHPNRSELKVVEFIKKLIKCNQLKLCKLESASYIYRPTWESISAHLSEENTLVPDSPNIRRYPILGSTDFYEINLGGASISIERKS
ncbi:hypothetical protein CRE_25940 [Caenorhabditis remanei]|uniref:F-box domain-containing protein n=1 Tax=Caenorhabditis remanei TaxID=31234 RepID=E3NK07_CAERE|nr:hypothetical protein CRE_25940 [Caenorhabditis remanei]